MALNPSSFVTRTALENFSIRAANEMTDYIADQVFTPIIVGKDSIKVYQYDTSGFRVSNTKKASSAEADLVDYGVFTTDRTPLLNKLAGEYDPADAKNFDVPVNQLQQDTARTIMDRLMLAREIQMADKALLTTNYPSDLTATLAAGSTWLDSSGDPEGNAGVARAAVKARCGKSPNAAAMSWTTFEKLRGAPYFIDRMKYTNASATADGFKVMLAAWLGVKELHICAALKNTNQEGNATQSLTDVWGDEVLFYVKDDTASLRSMRYGAKYLRNQLYTYSYQDDRRGSGDGRIQRIEVGWWYSLEAGAVVSSTDSDFSAGYLLKNVV